MIKMLNRLPKDIIISIMRCLDKVSIRVLSTIYRSIYIFVTDSNKMNIYGFDANISTKPFINLIYESDNLDLFKKTSSMIAIIQMQLYTVLNAFFHISMKMDIRGMQKLVLL